MVKLDGFKSVKPEYVFKILLKCSNMGLKADLTESPLVSELVILL